MFSEWVSPTSHAGIEAALIKSNPDRAHSMARKQEFPLAESESKVFWIGSPTLHPGRFFSAFSFRCLNWEGVSWDNELTFSFLTDMVFSTGPERFQTIYPGTRSTRNRNLYSIWQELNGKSMEEKGDKVHKYAQSVDRRKRNPPKTKKKSIIYNVLK
ncbi:hypothetical protein CDAR_466301 [Caerostris darwini]|uniref:Uncharacterized protein n=1 Tax=Caerostris darwini TaxID=1538125 RepID=A0AAV4WQ75_9ARAC|nr:hypothetical protein CDAR_466301 [Caerostris darwini]